MASREAMTRRSPGGASCTVTRAVSPVTPVMRTSRSSWPGGQVHSVLSERPRFDRRRTAHREIAAVDAHLCRGLGSHDDEGEPRPHRVDALRDLRALRVGETGHALVLDEVVERVVRATEFLHRHAGVEDGVAAPHDAQARHIAAERLLERALASRPSQAERRGELAIAALEEDARLRVRIGVRHDRSDERSRRREGCREQHEHERMWDEANDHANH